MKKTATGKRRYAERTSVTVRKSKMQIEDIIEKYGADSFASGSDGSKYVVMFRLSDRHVKFFLDVGGCDDQEERRRFRSLFLIIKAKLEAVETGIVTFDNEFMAHIVLPNGQLMGEVAVPQIENAYKTGEMPTLLEDLR